MHVQMGCSSDDHRRMKLACQLEQGGRFSTRADQGQAGGIRNAQGLFKLHFFEWDAE